MLNPIALSCREEAVMDQHRGPLGWIGKVASSGRKNEPENFRIKKQRQEEKRKLQYLDTNRAHKTNFILFIGTHICDVVFGCAWSIIVGRTSAGNQRLHGEVDHMGKASEEGVERSLSWLRLEVNLMVT